MTIIYSRSLKKIRANTTQRLSLAILDCIKSVSYRNNTVEFKTSKDCNHILIEIKGEPDCQQVSQIIVAIATSSIFIIAHKQLSSYFP